MSRQPLPRLLPTNNNAGYSNLDSSSTQRSPYGSPSRASPLNPNPDAGRNHYDAPRGFSPQRSFGTDSQDSLTSSSLDHRGAAGIATGSVGKGYGPYAYEPVGAQPGAGGGERNAYTPRPSRDSSLPSSKGGQSRYTPRVSSVPSPFANSAPPSSSGHSSSPLRTGVMTAKAAAKSGASAPLRNQPAWTARDAELDDKLHNPSPHDSLRDRAACAPFSARGWLNSCALLIMVAGLVSLFAGYPIVQYYTSHHLSTYGAYGIGGINSTGQVPDIPGLPSLIDSATPQSALSRTGFDGQKYVLMFSDEFNTDGRTFWPGDDPFWEAVDLHYWATGDFEWYDPDAVTTADGKLVITVTEEPIHNLNFRSGMLQSWNKFCFTGGYIEVSIQLPGKDSISGFWPGAWTMGNLARAGYGSTTDGTWPYSYDSCDIGTLVNQTWVNGTGPDAALTSGPKEYGNQLSYLPGQRLSACSCKGSDHPGPTHDTGRGAPEIDIIEAQVSYLDGTFVGSVSQSAQFAPFDASYEYQNTTPDTVVYDSTKTFLNTYTGAVYQQAVSAVTYTDATAYELGGAGFSKYGWESWPDPDTGFITWSVGDTAVWTLNAAAMGANPESQVGQRLISQEPMHIVLNLGISSSFQTIEYNQLKFPATMLVDYVRVYQREDSPNIGCDPAAMPTADYIDRHMNAYTNPNFTKWSEAGYDFPGNSLLGQC